MATFTPIPWSRVIPQKLPEDNEGVLREIRAYVTSQADPRLYYNHSSHVIDNSDGRQWLIYLSEDGFLDEIIRITDKM